VETSSSRHPGKICTTIPSPVETGSVQRIAKNLYNGLPWLSSQTGSTLVQSGLCLLAASLQTLAMRSHLSSLDFPLVSPSAHAQTRPYSEWRNSSRAFTEVRGSKSTQQERAVQYSQRIYPTTPIQGCHLGLAMLVTRVIHRQALRGGKRFRCPRRLRQISLDHPIKRQSSQIHQ